MSQPKNVEAVFSWYTEKRPDMLAQIKAIFDGRTSVYEAMQALLLQGFEAGREFERKHPEIESGIGYMNE